MPIFFMDIWSGSDLGMGGNSLGVIFPVFQNGGTFTVQADADNMAVNDDDPDFEDDGSVIGPSEIPDLGAIQSLAQDLFIDGSLFGTAGQLVFAAATSSVTNTTTGESGELIYVTLNDGTGSTFVGFASTIQMSIGDQITVGPGSFIASAPYDDLVCFTDDAILAVKGGTKPIAALEKGDLVKTRDNGFQPVQVIAKRTLTLFELSAHPQLWPIEISPQAPGFETLTAPLTVSPQHRFVHKSPHAHLFFGMSEVLIPAKAFLGQPGVRRVEPTSSLTYYHLIFDRHEVIFSNGVPTESLHLNDRTLLSLGAQSVRDEIAVLFPELTNGAVYQDHNPCLSLTQREAAALLEA
jgi:hypothetical protein